MKQRKTFNPAKGWENHWVQYADGVMEPVRDGQDISQKKSGPGQHSWMVIGKPVDWHPFDEGKPMTLNRPPVGGAPTSGGQKTTGQKTAAVMNPMRNLVSRGAGQGNARRNGQQNSRQASRNGTQSGDIATSISNALHATQAFQLLDPSGSFTAKPRTAEFQNWYRDENGHWVKNNKARLMNAAASVAGNASTNATPNNPPANVATPLVARVTNPLTGSATDFSNPFAPGGTGGHFAASIPLGKPTAASGQQVSASSAAQSSSPQQGTAASGAQAPAARQVQAAPQASNARQAPRAQRSADRYLSNTPPSGKLAGADRDIGEQFFQSLKETVARQEQMERQAKLAGADRMPANAQSQPLAQVLKLAGADRMPGQNAQPGLDQTPPAQQNTPQAKQDARSQWLREYEERGFLGNFLHAGEQLADKVPGAVEQATVEGGKAAGKALVKTADELATNEELQKAFFGTLGAGSLPILAALVGVYGPAVAAPVVEKVMSIGAGIKSVDKLREIALAPETWDSIQKWIGRIENAVPNALTPPSNPSDSVGNMIYIWNNMETLLDNIVQFGATNGKE